MFVIFNEKCSKRFKIKQIKLIIQTKSEQMPAITTSMKIHNQRYLHHDYYIHSSYRYKRNIN